MEPEDKSLPRMEKFLYGLAAFFFVLTVLFGMFILLTGAFTGYLHDMGEAKMGTAGGTPGIASGLFGSALFCVCSTPMGFLLSLFCLAAGLIVRRAHKNAGAASGKDVFQNVWYLPDENTWSDFHMMAYKDTGTLFLHADRIEFQGRKEKVILRDIKGIRYGKQGRDFMNSWVQVEYGEASKAFFADGSYWGWGGVLGGTMSILNAVRHRFPPGEQG